MIISAILLIALVALAAVFLTGEGGLLEGRFSRASRIKRKPPISKQILPAYNENAVHQCSDGIDNDNDGYTDYPDDKKCTSKYETELKEVPTGCANSKTIMWGMAFNQLTAQQYYSPEETFNYLKAAKNNSDGECYLHIRDNDGPINNNENSKGNEFVFITGMDRIDVGEDYLSINQVVNMVEGSNDAKNRIMIRNDNYQYPLYNNDHGYTTYNNSWFTSNQNTKATFIITTPVYGIYRISSTNVDWEDLKSELEYTPTPAPEGGSSFENMFHGTDLLTSECPYYFEQIYPNTMNDISWEEVSEYVATSADDDCRLAVVATYPYAGLSAGLDLALPIEDLIINSSTKTISYQFETGESFSIDLSKPQPEFTASILSHNQEGEGGVMYIKSKYFRIDKSNSLSY